MTSNLRVVRHADAAAFLHRAEPWLLQAEAEHNLLLALAHAMRAGDARFDPPIYLATIESDGAVVGCAFRTPPFKLGLTRMPADAAAAVAADVATVYDALPAVLGPEDAAFAFARRWAALRHVDTARGMRQRIHQLDRVADDLPHGPGTLRRATHADRELVLRWFHAFHAEVEVEGGDVATRVDPRIAAGDIRLWEVDGAVVALAGIAGRSPNGARVGPVYTPPELRGRGYATAAVGELSREILAGGARFCFLYTDLANPTSNAIYARIGYRPVCDVVDVTFRSR